MTTHRTGRWRRRRATNGAKPDVAPAWVIVAPPDFVPGMTNVVTLWDVMQDVATTRGVLPAPANPSFTNDVYPILSRTCFLHWVNDLASSGHSPNTSGDFSSEWALLANKKSKAAKEMRGFVFNVVRDPRLLAKVVEGKATAAEKVAAQAQATSGSCLRCRETREIRVLKFRILAGRDEAAVRHPRPLE